MLDRIGQQLGNYRLTKLLGQGGFAEVYLGEHPVLGTTVAIKVLHAQVTQDDVAQFQEEARLLASLRHSHIVRVFDFGLDEQTPYLVMDYAPNGTLRTRHPKSTTLPVPTIVSYVKQVAEALQYAHERKIAHRDVKPENMLVGENNEILLSDFGIALITQSSRYQPIQDVIGTAAYMAPEQVQGRPRSASDQYALGIVVYEWLSGKRPFQGSFPELCTQHMFASPPPLSGNVPPISPEVERVVTTALAKDPKQRFGSVRAFATALEQACQDILPTERFRSTGRLVTVPTSPLPANAISTPSTPAEGLALPLNQPAGLAVMPTRQINQSISVHTTEVPQHPPVSTRTTGRPTISRRVVFIGIAGAVAAAAAGGGIFSVMQQHPVSQGVTPTQPTVPPQTPTVSFRYQPFTYRGHTDLVRGVAWSPDGGRIASASWDNTVQVWDAVDGSHVFSYKGHTAPVWGVTWSPDGKRIASGSRDKTVQVWNASDGSNVFTYTGHASSDVNVVAWSPDGKRIASGSDDKTVQVWNTSDGSSVFTYPGHTDMVWSVAWSPDAKWIASGSRDNTVQVWNANGGNKVFTYRGHSGAVKGVAWSPDGKRIASGSDDKTAQVWNASDGGSNVFTYKGHSNTVWSIAWSPDGKRIASGSLDKTVQVWNSIDGGGVFTYPGHTGLVGSVSWSPDGNWVVSGSLDKTAQVWHVG